MNGDSPDEKAPAPIVDEFGNFIGERRGSTRRGSTAFRKEMQRLKEYHKPKEYFGPEELAADHENPEDRRLHWHHRTAAQSWLSGEGKAYALAM